MKLLMLVNNKEDIELEKIKLQDDMCDEYKDMFCEVKEVLEHHPKTWDEYECDDDGCDKIINMEIKELVDAKKKFNFEDLEHEYIHCASAFLHAYLTIKDIKKHSN